MKITLPIILLILLLTPFSVIAHGDEHQDADPQDEQVTLSLETILLMTVLVGLVLLFILFRVIGIKDQDLLLRMAGIALLLLLVDYIYLRFLR